MPHISTRCGLYGVVDWSQALARLGCTKAQGDGLTLRSAPKGSMDACTAQQVGAARIKRPWDAHTYHAYTGRVGTAKDRSKSDGTGAPDQL